MSRVVNLGLDGTKVRAHCATHDIPISVIEDLPDGGVRLVCSSSSGAQVTREKLKKHVLPDDVARAHPGRKLPYR